MKPLTETDRQAHAIVEAALQTYPRVQAPSRFADRVMARVQTKPGRLVTRPKFQFPWLELLCRMILTVTMGIDVAGVAHSAAGVYGTIARPGVDLMAAGGIVRPRRDARMADPAGDAAGSGLPGRSGGSVYFSPGVAILIYIWMK